MRGLVVGTLAVTVALLGAPAANAAPATTPATTPATASPPGTVASPGTEAVPVTPATGGAGNHYVALGDSWAAGSVAGALDPASNACRRSANAYPPRVAREAAGTFWISRSCASSARAGNGQFDVLDRNTRVVTATVGSDATGLGALARACSQVGTPAACTAAAGRFDRALAALPRALDASLTDMRRRAPTATITVTGFPLLAQGRTCATGPADIARARRLDDAVTRLDGVLADRTAAAKMRFVDVRPTFTGHGVCTADPWIAPFTGAEALLAGSATAAGHARGFAPALSTAIREAAAAPGTPTPAAPAPGTPAPTAPAPGTPAPTSAQASEGRSPEGRSPEGLAAPLFAG